MGYALGVAHETLVTHEAASGLIGQRHHHAPRRAVGALILAIVVGYFAACYSRPANEPVPQEALYALLTEAFLSGTTSLPVEPDPRLLALANPYRPEAPYRLHDASLYRGKYYLYFGPAPVLTVLLPYRVLTGSHMPSRIAVPLFCSLGFLCSCGLFYVLKERAGWSCPPWLELAVILSLGSAQMASFLLVRAMFYEVAISTGYFVVMAGLLLIAWSLGVEKRRPYLALAGLSFGLAVGSRPHLALVAMLMIVFVGAWTLRFRLNRATLAWFVAPILGVGVLLAAYNYARFDSPFEFGLSYQTTSCPSGPGLRPQTANLLPGLNRFLLLPPRVDATFPFLHSNRISPYIGYPPTLDPERIVGFLPAAPLALFGFFSFRRYRPSPDAAAFAASLVRWIFVCSLLMVLFLSVTGWTIGRYIVDFAPLWIFAACSVAVVIWQNHERMPASLKRLLGTGILASAAWTVLLNLGIEVPTIAQIKHVLAQ